MSFQINEVWAFCVVNPADGDEGIMGMHTGSGWMPMVCGDRARMESLRPVAEDLAKATGLPVKLKRFTGMVVEEIIGAEAH